MLEPVVPRFADLVEVVVGTATSTGHRRRVNEDSLLAEPDVYVVADGMGGHAAGDVASAIVVEELRSLVGGRPTAQDVERVLQGANVRVRGLANGSAAGTTVTGALGVEQDGAAYWLVLNLGDSRAYQLADGRLVQLSVDHSVVQEMLDRGELDAAGARRHPQRHVVTRAVGSPAALEPDFWLVPAMPGERLLLCSDGLTVELEDPVLEAVLQQRTDPQEAAEALVELALEAGGRDNVTVVVLDVHSRVGADEPAEQTLPRTRADCDVEQTQPRQEVAT